MKKYVLLMVLMLVPAFTLAQGVTVTWMYPPVEIRSAAGAEFVKVSSDLPTLDIGDEIRTGPGGSATLELPDGSWIVVSENTTLKIEQFWGSDVRNLMRVMLGKVRFYIQRLGGRPNRYRVNTPTALIAVRGTEFEVVCRQFGSHRSVLLRRQSDGLKRRACPIARSSSIKAARLRFGRGGIRCRRSTSTMHSEPHACCRSSTAVTRPTPCSRRLPESAVSGQTTTVGVARSVRCLIPT